MSKPVRQGMEEISFKNKVPLEFYNETELFVINSSISTDKKMRVDFYKFLLKAYEEGLIFGSNFK